MIGESSQLHDISCVLLMSDFNVPAIDWQELALLHSDTFTAEFLCAVQDSYLLQHVIGFTHHRQDQRPSLLDLVFTNNPDIIIDYVRHYSPLGFSDHECLMWQHKVSTMDLTYQQLFYQYKCILLLND